MNGARLATVVHAAEELTANFVPVSPLISGRKNPVPRPKDNEDDIGMYIVEEPDEVEPVFRGLAGEYGDLNLGMIVGRQKGSLILSVGLDIYKSNGSQAIDWAREVGVSSRDLVWIVRTGRGGQAIIYRHNPNLELKRTVEPDGIPIDLLVNGIQVAPPSNTFREPRGGGLYTWYEGHSPSDIPVTELMEPPDALIEFWQAHNQAGNNAVGGRPAGWVSDLLSRPITEGHRDETLAKIAGHLSHYHDIDIVESLLHCVNDARCAPALPESQVRKIALSIGGRERRKNGHFKGVPVAPMGDSP